METLCAIWYTQLDSLWLGETAVTMKEVIDYLNGDCPDTSFII